MLFACLGWQLIKVRYRFTYGFSQGSADEDLGKKSDKEETSNLPFSDRIKNS